MEPFVSVSFFQSYFLLNLLGRWTPYGVEIQDACSSFG
jgi:hypothetical protein